MKTTFGSTLRRKRRRRARRPPGMRGGPGMRTSAPSGKRAVIGGSSAAAARNSSQNTAASGQRCFGCRASARVKMRSISAPGRCPSPAESACCASPSRAASASATLVTGRALASHSASTSTMAKAYTSVHGPSAPSDGSNCSGAPYDGEQKKNGAIVFTFEVMPMASSFMILASPKSSTFMRAAGAAADVGEEEVPRLQIAMDDPLRVRVGDRVGRGAEHPHDLVERPPAEPAGASILEIGDQRGALEPLERHVGDELAGERRHGRAAGHAPDDVEVPLREAVAEPALLAEALGERGDELVIDPAGELQALHRHRLAETEVRRLVDEAEPALPDRLLHAELRVDDLPHQAESVGSSHGGNLSRGLARLEIAGHASAR